MNRNESRPTGQTLRQLAIVFAGVTKAADMEALFDELFTPPERSDFCLRWRLLEQLHNRVPQRKIAADLGISLCKITRGAKVLKKKDAVIRRILDGKKD
jgi:TrpR family trp operon transcriptional repressor